MLWSKPGCGGVSDHESAAGVDHEREWLVLGEEPQHAGH